MLNDEPKAGIGGLLACARGVVVVVAVCIVAAVWSPGVATATTMPAVWSVDFDTETTLECCIESAECSCVSSGAAPALPQSAAPNAQRVWWRTRWPGSDDFLPDTPSRPPQVT